MQSVRATLVVGELEPVGHAVHKTLPVVSLYFPVTHAVHGPPSGPVCPVKQMQFVTDELVLGEEERKGHARHVAEAVAPTVVEYVPTPQLEHMVAPRMTLYFPAMQAVQTPPLGPV